MRLWIRSSSRDLYGSSHTPDRREKTPCLLTFKDGSVVLGQEVLVGEEIEMIHQGAGHEEGHGALKGEEKILELPKSSGETCPGNLTTTQPHLLQQAHHAGVGVQVQGQGPGKSFLVLQAAGIELGPEFHLQLPKLLRGALVFCHTALELAGAKQRNQE